jgi:predicted TIM-barrel fold metal-dependent hydrolase
MIFSAFYMTLHLISAAHCVPDWYRSIVPKTGGNPTPSWNVSGHLSFMESEGISRAVLAFSAPGANVYPENQAATVALARLINEQTAAYARAYPNHFTFYAVVPLPYTQHAIAEAKYALDTLGAAGIALYSNFEGHYLGDPSFTPFFAAMNARGNGQIIYVHPTTPYLRVNGSLIEANPTTYPTGNIEFFFETARMLGDLAVSQTILNFTNINYIIPHVPCSLRPHDSCATDTILLGFSRTDLLPPSCWATCLWYSDH